MSEGGGEFLPPVVARMVANITEFKAKMGEARAEMAETEVVGEKAGKGTAAKYGGAIAGGALIAAAAIGAYSLKAGIDMQAADSKLAAHGDLSEAQAKRIGDAFLNTGFKFTVSGKEMVAALSPVAGQLKDLDGHALTTAESVRFMTDANSLAEATGNKLGDTTKTLAGVMQAYGIKAKDAAGVTDDLWNVSKSTGIGVDQLATMMERLKAKLGLAAPSLGEVSGLILDMTRHGVTGKAAIAGVTSGMSGLFKNLGKDAGDAAKVAEKQAAAQVKALQDIGKARQHLSDIEELWRIKAESGKVTASELAAHEMKLRDAHQAVDTATQAWTRANIAGSTTAKTLGLHVYDATGKFVGMKSVMTQLAPILAHQTDAQKKATLEAIFGAGAATSLFKVFKAGVPGLDAATKAATKHGTAEEAAGKATKNIKADMEKLEAGVQNLATRLGEWLIPKLTSFVEWLQKAATWLGKHKIVLEVVAGVIGGALVVAFGAWAASALAAAAATIAAMAPILLVIAGIGLLVAAIVYAYTHWSWFRTGVEAAWKGIQAAAKFAWFDVLKPTFEAIKGFILNDLVPAVLWLWHNVFEPAWKGISAGVQVAWRDVIKPAVAAGMAEFKGLETAVLWLWHKVFEPAWHGISSAVGTAWTVISAIFDKITGGIKTIMDALSHIPGVGKYFKGSTPDSGGVLAGAGGNTATKPWHGNLGVEPGGGVPAGLRSLVAAGAYGGGGRVGGSSQNVVQIVVQGHVLTERNLLEFIRSGLSSQAKSNPGQNIFGIYGIGTFA